MFKKILQLSLIGFLFFQSAEAKVIKKPKVVTKAKHFKVEENAAFLLGGVTLNYTDHRIQSFYLKCENLNTGKITKCFSTKRVQEEVFSSGGTYSRSAMELYKFPTGKYRLTELRFKTKIASKLKNNKTSLELDQEVIGLADLNITFDIQPAVNYIGMINFHHVRDAVFKPRVASYNVYKDQDIHLNLLNEKIKAQAQDLFLNQEINSLLDGLQIKVKVPYSKQGQWASLDEKSDEGQYCDYEALLISGSRNFKKAKVADGKLHVSIFNELFPVFTSYAFARSVECGLYEYMVKNNFKEFRQKSNVEIQEGKSILKGKFDKGYVFGIEFR